MANITNTLNNFLVFIKRFLIKKFPNFAMIYEKYTILRKLRSKPKITPHGFLFYSTLESMEKGNFEKEETEIILKILEKVDIVINIGANTGYYCCLSLNKGKYVIAFEPLYNNLLYLYKNIQLNNWQDRIEIFPVALSNKIGLTDIYGYGPYASMIKGWAGIPEEFVQKVPTLTLDIALNSRLYGKKCLIIVDIEGYEKAMLEGASLLINMNPKPVWMVEISTIQQQPKEIGFNPHFISTFKIFFDAGYEAWTAEEKMKPISEKSLNINLRELTENTKVYNYLFFERNKKNYYID